MNYFTKLIKSYIPILKYIILSYLIVFISYLIYYLLGYNNINNFILNYANYIIVIFNIIYTIKLIKKHKIKPKITNNPFPMIILGISLSTLCNMIIIKYHPNNAIEINKTFLILSSVIIGPIIEEILFRFILTNNLLKFNNKTNTILLSSLLFGLTHTGLINILYAFILGITLNTIFIKKNNIINTIIIHSSANLISLYLTTYNTTLLLISIILFTISILAVKKELNN